MIFVTLTPLKYPVQEKALILGIESSCDETAASVVLWEKGKPIKILSSIIASQNTEHAPYGGVVPEIAARAHLLKIEGIIENAVQKADINYVDLNAIAATAGPGLIGGVITGLMAAKGISMSLNIPLIAVNHLEGHALSPSLSEDCPFPYLLLLVSGGHTQLLSVKGLGNYRRIGSTLDDAAGEAFDKTAKVMGLGFPGGPKVEHLAKSGDSKAVDLPRPLKGKNHADFSFAGLKTAVSRAYNASNKTETAKANIAASFQEAVCDVLNDRSRRAMKFFIDDPDVNSDKKHHFVVAGGVAANTKIRESLETLCKSENFKFVAPPLKYCTDNAAMIALAGAQHYAVGNFDNISVKARPRWPLDMIAATQKPKSGYGKKGPKS